MSQTESGVAEQMVGMSIRAMESLSRVLASGAKNLAVFLFSVAKGTKQYRGITSVRNLLDGGHELMTLELDKKELHDFCLHAKKNDIPCTIIHDKKLYQDVVPVLVRKVDAERVNRVVDKMRLQHLPEDRAEPAVPERETERAPENPTTGRTNFRSQPRSRFRPSERASGGRGNIASISPSSLRSSVKAKILDMRRERRAARTPDIQPSIPQSAQSPAWYPRDDQMMETMRQLLLALTTITQEVMGQPNQPGKENAAPSRSSDGKPFRSRTAEPRVSVRDRVAQVRDARANRSAQPSKSRKTGRGGR